MFCAVGSSWFHHLSGHILKVYIVISDSKLQCFAIIPFFWGGGGLFGGDNYYQGNFLWQSLKHVYDNIRQYNRLKILSEHPCISFIPLSIMWKRNEKIVEILKS